MKKNVLIFLLVLTLALPLSLVSAQGDSGKHQVELPDGTVISLPAEWEFAEDAGIYLFSAGEDHYVAIHLPAITATYYESLAAAPTPAELLVSIYTDILKSTIDEEAIQPREGGVEYAFEDAAHQGVSAVLEWDEGLLFYLSYAPLGEYDAVKTVVEDILGQLPKASAAVECFVSTDKSYGVPLRLGPGLNRGEITSLTPKDGQVAVLGQAEANDGSLWWRVDKTIPDANELWVADTDVIKTGNCTAVGEAVAPGIIAPAPGFVPVQPTPSGPVDTGGGQPDTGTAPADTSLVPRSGTWNVQYPATLNLSCQGTGNVTVPNDLEEFPNGNFTLTSPDGGQTLIWTDPAGYVVLIQDAPGHYTGNGTVNDPNWYAVLYLHVTSPTNVWGELIFGIFTPPCSGSMNFSITFVG